MNIGRYKIEFDDELKKEGDIIRQTAKITFALCVIFVIIIGGTFYFLISFWGPLKPVRSQINSGTNGIGYALMDLKLDDDMSDFVVIYCGKENTSYDKTTCVQTIMKSNFNYAYHNETVKSLGSMMETGGVCRDYANNFCRIMNRMEINCYLVPVTNHVFSVVEFRNNNGTRTAPRGQCVVDMENVFCW